jgi:His/Glu/Gln/Arg/opine family amino acid ABC transporter permease subunit
MPLLGFVEQLGLGALITIQVAVLSYLLALLVGTLFALATVRRKPVMNIVWQVYASIFTGVPSLLVAFLFYYAGSGMIASLFSLVGMRVNIEVNPFAAAVVALGLVYGAYIADIVRSAIHNVPAGQFEAANVLLIPRPAAWFFVILPQVLRLALPALTNMWIVVLKDTALISLIGLKEIMTYARLASGVTKEPFIYYILAAAFFLLMTGLTYLVSQRVEGWTERGTRRRAAPTGEAARAL